MLELITRWIVAAPLILLFWVLYAVGWALGKLDIFFFLLARLVGVLRGDVLHALWRVSGRTQAEWLERRKKRGEHYD